MPSGSQDPALSEPQRAGVTTRDAGDGAGRRVSHNVLHAAARHRWVDYESTFTTTSIRRTRLCRFNDCATPINIMRGNSYCYCDQILLRLVSV